MEYYFGFLYYVQQPLSCYFCRSLFFNLIYLKILFLLQLSTEIAVFVVTRDAICYLYVCTPPYLAQSLWYKHKVFRSVFVLYSVTTILKFLLNITTVCRYVIHILYYIYIIYSMVCSKC